MKVVVVGGGAAGMMAAISAAENGHEVTVLEKNEKLGKKLFITGKGRCNVCNDCEDEVFFNSVMNNSKFLYSAFYGYMPWQVKDFFEEHGCKLKVERGNRVFPVSDHSSDIIKALSRVMNELGVRVVYHADVTDLSVMEGKVEGVYYNNRLEKADAVIMCTGGLSYPQTGSDGKGHEILSKHGHRITPMHPALVPFETAQEWCRDLMGLSLKNVSFTLKSAQKVLYSEQGEMLFTHFGVSGPLILSASSTLKEHDFSTLSGHIDLKPALSHEKLDERLLRDFDENKNKCFKNALGGLFPSKLIPVMIMLSGIDPEKKVCEIARTERKEFVSKIKDLSFDITGTRDYKEAIITRGGVSVRDVNPSTMESKQIKGLYIAGEMLDVDALTGGYNLQIAWSTGHLAGMLGGGI